MSINSKFDCGVRMAAGSIVIGGLLANVGATPVMLVATLTSIPLILSGFLGWGSNNKNNKVSAPSLYVVNGAGPQIAGSDQTWRRAA